jgi:Skp family chaperone for outer membrane proteins
LKYLLKENAKIQALADHGIDFLFEAEKNYRTRNFRTSLSPAIQSAAKQTVEEKGGLSTVPFKGSLLCECECEDEEDHKLWLIDDVAHAICKSLEKREDAEAKEAENEAEQLNCKVENEWDENGGNVAEGVKDKWREESVAFRLGRDI